MYGISDEIYKTLSKEDRKKIIDRHIKMMYANEDDIYIKKGINE